MQHATEQKEQIKHLSLVTLAFLLGDKQHSEVEREANVDISTILTLIYCYLEGQHNILYSLNQIVKLCSKQTNTHLALFCLDVSPETDHSVNLSIVNICKCLNFFYIFIGYI